MQAQHHYHLSLAFRSRDESNLAIDREITCSAPDCRVAIESAHAAHPEYVVRLYSEDGGPKRMNLRTGDWVRVPASEQIGTMLSFSCQSYRGANTREQEELGFPFNLDEIDDPVFQSFSASDAVTASELQLEYGISVVKLGTNLWRAYQTDANGEWTFVQDGPDPVTAVLRSHIEETQIDSIPHNLYLYELHRQIDLLFQRCVYSNSPFGERI